MTEVVATNETILVVGGGISGMTAALEAAETGKRVVLVEKRPYVGGRVSQLYKYFPKLCFPTCGLEINQRRGRMNPNLTILTMAEVTGLKGEKGNYTATVKLSPRYVNHNCTACGDCTKAVEAQFDDEYNYGLSKRSGAYLPYRMAQPARYVLDPAIIGTPDADKAKAACKYNAIDLDMQEETIDFPCGAVIWATGWRPYDAAKIQPYGYDRFKNVITSVEFERLADPTGPTGGKLLRPSDGKEAKNVAFIQCAGSRDRNHLLHCSRICCMASLKQATYVSDAFAEGADGVLIGGCHPGDCHYQEGNYKALRRVHLLKRLLRDLGIEDARFRLEWISASEGDKVRTVINEMVRQVRDLGPLKVQVPREVFAEEVQ